MFGLERGEVRFCVREGFEACGLDGVGHWECDAGVFGLGEWKSARDGVPGALFV